MALDHHQGLGHRGLPQALEGDHQRRCRSRRSGEGGLEQSWRLGLPPSVLPGDLEEEEVVRRHACTLRDALRARPDGGRQERRTGARKVRAPATSGRARSRATVARMASRSRRPCSSPIHRGEPDTTRCGKGCVASAATTTRPAGSGEHPIPRSPQEQSPPARATADRRRGAHRLRDRPPRSRETGGRGACTSRIRATVNLGNWRNEAPIYTADSRRGLSPGAPRCVEGHRPPPGARSGGGEPRRRRERGARPLPRGGATGSRPNHPVLPRFVKVSAVVSRRTGRSTADRTRSPKGGGLATSPEPEPGSKDPSASDPEPATSEPAKGTPSMLGERIRGTKIERPRRPTGMR
jgi:hypothetical protein